MAPTNLRHLLHQYKVWDEIKFLLPAEAAHWEISIDDKHLHHTLDRHTQHHFEMFGECTFLFFYREFKLVHQQFIPLHRIQ